MDKKKLIIISGATATGKTSYSLELAKKLIEKDIPAEIVNFDSLLFYKELNIGTAKPTKEELGRVKHHLIDTNSITSPVNAASYYKKAVPVLNELLDKGITPILVGGSGFYIRAIVKGMYQSETPSSELQKEMESLYQDNGITPFREYLRKYDQTSFKDLHENDHYRNMRAYEHHRQTGTKLSDQKHQLKEKGPYDFSTPENPNWEFLHIYMELDKESHWRIIEDRTTQMIKQGLVKEVQNLGKNKFSMKEKPLSAIGYKQVLEYLSGEISTEEELIERIYIATRRLAKSQKTFFQKIKHKYHLNPLKERDTANSHVLNFLKPE